MLNPKKLYLVNNLISFIPPSKGYKLKSKLFRWAGVCIGNNVRIISSAKIWGTGNLIIGDNTFIGHYSKILMGGSEVRIGKDVDISSMVTIINGTHVKYDTPNKAAGTGYSKDIIIDDGSWIGATVTILGGAIIGKLTIVGAGATLSRKLEPNKIYIGSKVQELK